MAVRNLDSAPTLRTGQGRRADPSAHRRDPGPPASADGQRHFKHNFAVRFEDPQAFDLRGQFIAAYFDLFGPCRFVCVIRMRFPFRGGIGSILGIFIPDPPEHTCELDFD